MIGDERKWGNSKGRQRSPGASERAIVGQTGQRNVNMVRRYIRDGSLFREKAAAKVAL